MGGKDIPESIGQGRLLRRGDVFEKVSAFMWLKLGIRLDWKKEKVRGGKRTRKE